MSSEGTMATTVSPHGTSAPTGTTSASSPRQHPLSDLRMGTAGRIVGLQEETASGPIIRRLSNLGFVPGRIVTPLRRAPLGDPIVYRVADYELCLRRHEACIVRVEAVTEADDIVGTEAETVTAPEAETGEGTAFAEPATEPTTEPATEPTTDPTGEEQHR